MLQAIDERPTGPYDVSEALEGLSILDDSFLDKFAAGANGIGGFDGCLYGGDNGLQTQSSSLLGTPHDAKLDHNHGRNSEATYSLPATATTTSASLSVPSDDGELWQSLLLEQKIRYEEQIQKLTKELMRMKHLVQSNQTPASNNKAGAGEKDKWVRINHILDNYFAEYNVQF